MRLGRRFTPGDQAARLRRKLDLAGNPAGWDTDRVLAFKMLGLLVLGVLGLLIPLVFFGNALWALVFAVTLLTSNRSEICRSVRNRSPWAKPPERSNSRSASCNCW